MPITPVEIRALDLPRAWLRGYPRAEVDELLEEIATSFEEVWQERTRLADRLRELEIEDGRHRELERLLHSTLVSAERGAAEMKAQAMRESDLIVQDARAESRRTTRELAVEKRRLEDDVARIRAQLQTALEAIGEPPRSESTTSDDLASATQEAAMQDDLDSGVRKVVI
jgi:cell division initiation protein